MKQVKAAVDHKVLHSNGQSPRSDVVKPKLFPLSPATNTKGNSSDGINYTLPPRRVADELVAVY